MATFTGAKINSPLPVSAGLSTSFDQGAFSLTGAWRAATNIPTGAKTNKGIINVASSTKTGVLVNSFKTYFYGRIHVNPRTIDLGLIFSPKQQIIEVWNAYLTDNPCSSAQFSGSYDGLALTSPGVFPIQFGALEAKSWTLDMTMDGGPNVNALLGFTFATETPVVSIKLSRLTVFSHRPDWSEPFEEKLSMLTEILPAYSGKEQRRSLRINPRYECTFRVLTTTPIETSALGHLITGRQMRVFGVPWWPELTFSTTGLLVGGNSFTADFTDRPSFKVGGMVLMWSDYNNWEAFQILSIVGNTMTLSSTANKQWVAGTKVLPLRNGRMSAEQQLTRPTNWTTGDSFTFSCEA